MQITFQLANTGSEDILIYSRKNRKEEKIVKEDCIKKKKEILSGTIEKHDTCEYHFLWEKEEKKVIFNRLQEDVYKTETKSFKANKLILKRKQIQNRNRLGRTKEENKIKQKN